MYSTVPSPPPVQWNSVPAPTLTLDRTVNTSTTPPVSPSSPTRRLRGLSYLRNYTQNHLLSRDSNNNSTNSSINNPLTSNQQHQRRPTSIGRAISYPAPTSPRSAAITSPIPSPEGILSPISPTVQTTHNLQTADSEGQAESMVRTRSATTGAALEAGDMTGAVVKANGETENKASRPSIRFMAHPDARASRPPLVFSPISRILPTGTEIIKVGRYSERENQPVGPPYIPSAAPVGFKSKVVSRRHCEFWCSGGQWYVKDVKSSSGTFLNHIRLSPPGLESKPFRVKDGDIVQLGIDFKGGEEMIFRCVKIQVELNKSWHTSPSNFDVQSHKRLRELNSVNHSASSTSQDCSICLGRIAPLQSLFVAPCSHTWHYKCIRVIINGRNWPQFICPNCRSVADLEADVDDAFVDWLESEGGASEPREEGPAETEAPTIPLAQAHDQSNGERAGAATETAAERGAESRSERDTEHESDLDHPTEASDESDDLMQVVNRTAHELDHVQLGDPPITAAHAASSSATSAPVDIISRKPVNINSNPIPQLRQPDTRSDRESTRTPSPVALGNSLDVAAGGEGPMTPRNDVGPFIFDGSGGHTSGTRLIPLANLNMAASTNHDPPPHDPPASS